VYGAACFVAVDERRFGREIVESVRPRILRSWSFEFAKDRCAKERNYSSKRLWRLLIKIMEIQKQ
jgi:hypothetical protein